MSSFYRVARDGGFNADLVLVPDLDKFVDAIRQSFEQLAEAAEVKLSPPVANPPF